MYTVAYRWIFCPRGWGGDGGVPYVEAGVLKTGKNSSAKINGLVTGTRGYRRESLKHGYYLTMTFCSDTPFGGIN